MKYYKDYPLIGFGMSDIASLVLVYFDNVDYEVQSRILHMGSDEAYRGRVVYNDVEIPSHYTKQFSINASWVKIYDDDSLVWIGRKDAIYEFYTAGERTLLININRKFQEKLIFLLDLIRKLVYYYNQIQRNILRRYKYVDRRAEEKD